MRKVLIFSTAYFPFIGGAEVALKQVTDRISDFEFDMVTARLRKDLKRQEKIGNINVYRVGFGSKIDKLILPILGLFKAVRLNEKNKYCLIYGLLASYGSLGAYFFKILHPRIPLLINLQEGKDLKGRFGAKNIIRRLVIKRANAITVISNYLKEFAEKNSINAKIELIPNGVDLNQFKPSNQESDLRSTLGLKQEDMVVVTHGRLVEKNGPIDLIKAFNILKEKNSNLKLLLVGDGLQRQKIEDLILEYGLKNNVIMAGEIPSENVHRYLEISDISIRPSLTEGLGNSFLEAMAMGLPVIGTLVGGIPDFLKDNETGIACKPGDAQDIADKIELLAQDKELRQRIAENGKNLVLEKYNWNNIAIKLDNFLNTLI